MGESWEWSGDVMGYGMCHAAYDLSQWSKKDTNGMINDHNHPWWSSIFIGYFYVNARVAAFESIATKWRWNHHFGFLLNHPQQPAVCFAVTTSFARGAWGVARGRSGVAGWKEKPTSCPQGQLSTSGDSEELEGQQYLQMERSWVRIPGIRNSAKVFILVVTLECHCNRKHARKENTYYFIYDFLWKQGTPKFTG